MARLVTFPHPPRAANGVLLRRLAADDVPWITAACSDPDMHRWNPGAPYPYTEANARRFLAAMEKSRPEGRRDSIMFSLLATDLAG